MSKKDEITRNNYNIIKNIIKDSSCMEKHMKVYKRDSI